MSSSSQPAPDSTAVRVALWRALHVQVDAAPHVLADELGLQIAAPEERWRARPDMQVALTSRLRASIVARARYIEDATVLAADSGVGQYVILGAGLDTFAQRRPDIARRLQLFEVDRPGPQAWKRQRLRELGFYEARSQHFVPVDFETTADWLTPLTAAGFKSDEPALLASTGVSMYLSHEANKATLQSIAKLAKGTMLIMSFLLPSELVDAADLPALEASIQGARAAGTPLVSFYAPEQLIALARTLGFERVEHVTAQMLAQRYFTKRSDGLHPGTAEQLLIATC